MLAGKESLHFIGLFGDFQDSNCVKARTSITEREPGALPDLIEGVDIQSEIEKNRAFMAELVVLTDYQHQLEAVRAAKAARAMGVKNVRVVLCA